MEFGQIDETAQAPITPEQELASLPDSRFIKDVAHPVLILIGSQVMSDRLQQRHLEQTDSTANEQIKLWGFLDLPPAPGCDEGALLSYLTPMNGGCAHQADFGSCLGCDYHPDRSDVTSDELGQQIDQLFSFIETGELPGGSTDAEKAIHDKYFSGSKVHLNIIASGSLLSPNEVPIQYRKKIFELTKKYKTEHPEKEIIFETECRVDDLIPFNPSTDSYETNEELLTQLDSLGMPVELGVGIESTNPIVSEGCFNKHLPPIEKVYELAKLLKEKHPNINMLPHIWLGAPFLTEEERIEDTVESINDVMDNGLTDKNGRVIMMVMNRRKLSVLGDTYLGAQEQLPEDSSARKSDLLPSIWSVGEVLRRIGKDRAKKIMIRGFVASDEFAKTVEACGQSNEEIALYNLVKNWHGTDDEWDKLQTFYEGDDLECGHKKSWESETKSMGASGNLEESQSFKQRLIEWYKAFLKVTYPIDLKNAIEIGSIEDRKAAANSYSRTVNPDVWGLG